MIQDYEILGDILYDDDDDNYDEEVSNTKDHPRDESNPAIVAYSAPTSMDLSDSKQSMYHSNFIYFLDNAIDCTKHSTLIVATEEVAEVYQSRIDEMNKELCHDSPDSIETTFPPRHDIDQYDYFLYVNCGMV